MRRAALIFAFANSLAYAQTPATPNECGGVFADPSIGIQACTRVIEFGGLDKRDLAKAYYARGTEWARQDMYDRAITDYGVAIELDPDFAPSYYNRALALSNGGDSDRAIADYDRAIKLKPDNSDAYIARAVERTVKGDYRLAVADYEDAIRLMPDSLAGYFGRARARFYAGDFMGAASDFYRAHQLAPSMYTAIWLFLARKRADIPGEKTLAADAGTASSDGWPAPVVALYLGTTTPDSVMRAATHPDAARQRDLRCEASFYVGHWHVLRGAREPAVQLLREAEATCPRTFIEQEGAVAELRRLSRR
jgi:lipoprotein NlpI